MAPRKHKPVVDSKVYTIRISGTAHDALVARGLFTVKPTSSRKVGAFGGKLYTYNLSRDSLTDLTDALTVLACDLADELGGDAYQVDQVYKDLDRFPKEAWTKP